MQCFPVWRKLGIWQRQSRVSTCGPGVLPGVTWVPVLDAALSASLQNQLLLPTASSCYRAVPNLLLPAWGSFSQEISVDWPIIFCFHTFPPSKEVDSFHPQISIFLSGQNSQKDFPKGLGSVQEELLEVGCRFGSVIYNRQEFGNSQEGTSPSCKLDYFLITFSTYQAGVESILLQFLRSCLSL